MNKKRVILYTSVAVFITAYSNVAYSADTKEYHYPARFTENPVRCVIENINYARDKKINEQRIEEYNKYIEKVVRKQIEDEEKAKKEKAVKEAEEKAKLEEYKKKEKERLTKENERRLNVSFNYDNITEKSNITAEELYVGLLGTNIEDCAWAIVECENIYGINAIVLSAIGVLESGNNSSDFAKYNNNLTGHGAFDNTNTAYTFSSRYECFYETARLLAKEYVNPGGLYYNGLSIDNVNTKYSSNVNWDKEVNQISNEILNRFKVEYLN